MQRLTRTIGAAVLGVLIGGTAQAADDAGWAVRICRGQSEAAAIKLTVGDGKTQKELVNWQSDNEQTDFPVPAPLTMAPKLHVIADSEPADGQVAICVMWKNTPAKAMKFNDLLEVSVAQTDTDDSCPCK
jgi:hypothetical protein